MRIKKVFYWFFMLSPFVFLGGHMLLIRNGYCYETGKFFSELDYQSLEDKAVEIIWNRLHPSKSSFSWKGVKYYDPIIPYKDIETFRKVNPDCCYFTQEQQHPAVQRTLFSGKVYGYIILRYWVFRSYPDQVPKERRHDYPPAKKEGEVFVVSTCGTFHYFSEFY